MYLSAVSSTLSQYRWGFVQIFLINKGTQNPNSEIVGWKQFTAIPFFGELPQTVGHFTLEAVPYSLFWVRSLTGMVI